MRITLCFTKMLEISQSPVARSRSERTPDFQRQNMHPIRHAAHTTLAVVAGFRGLVLLACRRRRRCRYWKRSFVRGGRGNAIVGACVSDGWFSRLEKLSLLFTRYFLLAISSENFRRHHGFPPFLHSFSWTLLEIFFPSVSNLRFLFTHNIIITSQHWRISRKRWVYR